MNLIVTCARHFEEETKNEIQKILNGLGDAEPDITITQYSGILTVHANVSPLDVIGEIRKKLEDEPWSIRYTLRAIPVFETVKAEVDSIAQVALSQTQKIGQNETYRITIEKRDSSVSSADIISQIADRVKNKVSLEKYDWIILVEIIGEIAGVSVLREDDVLSVERTKRKSFD